MTLEQEIAAWDGESAETISAVYAEHYQHADFMPELIALLVHEPLQKGTTWLLKRWLEEGGEISAENTQQYQRHASSLTHWESQLHLLQSLQYLAIDTALIDTLYAFIQTSLGSKNTFVRAWAYSGMYELAAQHTQFQDEVRALFTKAMAEEKASVRARIRQVMKKGF